MSDCGRNDNLGTGHQGALGGLEYIAEPLRFLAVPIDDLNIDPANARRHGQRNLDAIADSLTRWGQRLPVVVQREGMVVRAGNGRVEAARRLGWTHMAALVVDESSVDATAFAIADNRTAELAEWDDEVLADLLGSLPNELMLETGFDQADLDWLLEKVVEPAVHEGPPLRPLKMGWALVGVPIERWGEVADAIEAMAETEGYVVETTQNG